MAPRSSRRVGGFLVAVAGTTLVLGSLPAAAAQPTVGLGTAEAFAVLAGSTVTNTGPSVITGNVGVSPGTAISGFPPGTVNGTFHSADATAAQAQADTTTAYNDAAGRTPFTAVATELGGRTLQPGVYRNATLGLTGTLTLDAAGDPNAVFVFQADSTLITASASRVLVINGAQACNVFWQVGSSATLGTTTAFVGNVLALTSITANNGATVQGRLLARGGAVTLDDNTITRATCAAGATTTTTAGPTTTTTAPATTTTTPATAVTTAPPTPGAPAGIGTSGGTAGGSDGGSGVSPTAPTTGTGGAPAASGTATQQARGGATTGGSLARTGSGLPAMTLAGTLAMLLGAVLLRRSDARAQ